MSKDRQKLTYETLQEIRDDYIKLYSLNNAISSFIKASKMQVSEKVRKTSPTVISEREDADVLVKNCKQYLTSQITKLEKNIEESKRLAALNVGAADVGGLTYSDALVIADFIPAFLGKADFLQLLNGIPDKSGNLTLKDKEAILQRLKSILYYCNTDEDKADASTQLKDTGDYRLPHFKMEERTIKLQKLIETLKGTLDVDTELPDFYVITDIEQVFDKAQGKNFL